MTAATIIMMTTALAVAVEMTMMMLTTMLMLMAMAMTTAAKQPGEALVALSLEVDPATAVSRTTAPVLRPTARAPVLRPQKHWRRTKQQLRKHLQPRAAVRMILKYTTDMGMHLRRNRFQQRHLQMKAAGEKKPRRR